MLKRLLATAAIAAVAVAFAAPPAEASHCPKDVQAIKNAVGVKKMSKEQMMMGSKAADEGLALHKAGKHGKAIKVLHKAMDALGIKH